MHEKDRPELTDRQEAQARRRKGNSDFELGTVQAGSSSSSEISLNFHAYSLKREQDVTLRNKEIWSSN